MLDVQAFLGLRQRNALADVPELVRLREVLGHHGVAHAAVSPARFPAGARTARARGPPTRCRSSPAARSTASSLEQGTRSCGKCLATRLSANWPITSKPVRPAPRCWCARPSSVTAASSDGTAAQAVSCARRQRIELHRRGGDDAQRAFAADEQVAQVVAGVVLAQARQALPDLALRRDHFQPQAQLARVAVAHHLGAAGIGAPGCRRWCNCLRPPGSAGTESRPSRPLPAGFAARSRPRRSWSGWRRRWRAPRSCAAGSARTCVPLASGVEPTTSPVLPPCGTMLTAGRGAGLHHVCHFCW